jgi:hypothetical protein
MLGNTKVTDRQRNAYITIGIGILLLLATEPLANMLVGSSPYVLAAVHLLGPVGGIFVVIGLVRLNTKGTKP